ncbi:SDR family oxidoreductase [Thalassobacillus hwangdonensis]|uniref:SDR family oxidoreductase n=1 Tax=Thalassobacillus hwangdonensis TaxID=546108 RepID=A0ABW3KWK0_9BACI
MEKGVVIITGASSGFGYLTAVACAKEGYEVLATMRNLEKANQFEKEDKAIRDRIHFRQLDVTDHNSIQQFGASLKGEESVAGLINNAGIAVGGFTEEVGVDEFRKQFDTNFFGAVAVTQFVLPIMRRQGYGKIINLGSISGRVGFPGLSPYVASKHALKGWTESLRLEVKPFGVEVALIEAGSYKTNIWTTGTHIPDEAQQQSSPYRFYMEALQREFQTSSETHGDPEEIARLIVEILQEKRTTKLFRPVGKGVKVMMGSKTLLSWRSWEKLLLKQLFKR